MPVKILFPPGFWLPRILGANPGVETEWKVRLLLPQLHRQQTTEGKSAKHSAGSGIGIIIGAVVPIILSIAVATVIWQRKNGKRRRRREEEEKTDFNPVYATYEVHYDPVAEVGTLCSFQTKIKSS